MMEKDNSSYEDAQSNVNKDIDKLNNNNNNNNEYSLENNGKKKEHIIFYNNSINSKNQSQNERYNNNHTNDLIDKNINNNNFEASGDYNSPREYDTKFETETNNSCCSTCKCLIF